MTVPPRSVVKDMLAPARERELGYATHKQRCEELFKGILYTIDCALATSGDPVPGSEPEGGTPTVH